MLITEFCTFLEVERGYSDNTIREYSYDLKMFQGFVNDKEMEEVTTGDIRKFLLHLKRDKNYASRSLHRKICSLRSFYKFIQKENYIQRNPAETITSPKIPKSLPKTITVDETLKLITTPTNARDKCILYLLYSSGMRVSEIINLNIDHIDINDKMLRVIGGKGDKDRNIPLNSQFFKVLEEYLCVRKAMNGEEALIVNRSGTRTTTRSIQRLLKKYVEMSGIKKKITPHTLRHAFATHLLSNQVDIRVIQELLGHASLSTTQLYTHVTLTHLRKSYDGGHPLSQNEIAFDG